MQERLIWVDEDDNIIGYGEKMDTHIQKQLHRAFSIFIYDPGTGQVLLQKRAPGKYHSGGRWSNSGCSHPRKDEPWNEALTRCLREELGLELQIEHFEPDRDKKVLVQWDKCGKCDKHEKYVKYGEPDTTCVRGQLMFAGKFSYFADFGSLAEHETDYVFLCLLEMDRLIPDFHREEVSEVRWMAPDEISGRLSGCPREFSDWFGGAYELFLTSLSDYE